MVCLNGLNFFASRKKLLLDSKVALPNQYFSMQRQVVDTPFLWVRSISQDGIAEERRFFLKERCNIARHVVAEVVKLV